MLVLDWAEHGICGRGVLLDLVKFYTDNGTKPLPYDPWTSHDIPIQDLEACAKAQGVTFRTGDILLYRAGFTQKWYASTRVEREALHTRADTLYVDTIRQSSYDMLTSEKCRYQVRRRCETLSLVKCYRLSAAILVHKHNAGITTLRPSRLISLLSRYDRLHIYVTLLTKHVDSLALASAGTATIT